MRSNDHCSRELHQQAPNSKAAGSCARSLFTQRELEPKGDPSEPLRRLWDCAGFRRTQRKRPFATTTIPLKRGNVGTVLVWNEYKAPPGALVMAVELCWVHGARHTKGYTVIQPCEEIPNPRLGHVRKGRHRRKDSPVTETCAC